MEVEQEEVTCLPLMGKGARRKSPPEPTNGANNGGTRGLKMKPRTENLDNWCRQIRLARGLTQQGLAEAAGISISSLTYSPE